jgi:hypothetical protein
MSTSECGSSPHGPVARRPAQPLCAPSLDPSHKSPDLLKKLQTVLGLRPLASSGSEKKDPRILNIFTAMFKICLVNYTVAAILCLHFKPSAQTYDAVTGLYVCRVRLPATDTCGMSSGNAVHVCAQCLWLPARSQVFVTRRYVSVSF